MTQAEKEGFAQLEQRVAELETTVKDLAEIKEMLRLIIRHFGVGHLPAHSVRQIEAQVDRRVEQIKRKKRSKGGR